MDAADFMTPSPLMWSAWGRRPEDPCAPRSSPAGGARGVQRFAPAGRSPTFDSLSTRIRSPFSRFVSRRRLATTMKTAWRWQHRRWPEAQGDPGAARRQRRWQPRRWRDACRWPSKGVTCAGFLLSTRGRLQRWLSLLQSNTIRHDPRSEGPDRRCLCSGVRESSNSQLSPGLQRSLARRGQHRFGRHVGQLRGRTRHGRCRRGGLLGSAISVFERRQPRRRSSSICARPPARDRLFGSEVFPSGPLAQESWLLSQRGHRPAPRASRHTRDAVGHATHPRGAGARHDSEAARMTAEADLQAIRQMQEVLYRRLMPAGPA